MTLPKEFEIQIDEYLQKRDLQFDAIQKLAIHEAVASAMARQETALLADKKLAIRSELEALMAEKRSQQRNAIKYFIGLIGISAFAVFGFLWKEVNETANAAATEAISGPITIVEAAQRSLETANDEFDSIRAQITNTQNSAHSVQRQVVEMLREVNQALGAIKSAEGGVALANDLSRIYERLERMEYARRSQIDPASLGPTIEKQFFSDD